jgi:hypothetical protein
MDLTTEDKVKLSKQAMDSFVRNFDEGEASKKFVLVFLQILLEKDEEE